MASPFQTITVDGRRLEGPALLEWATELEAAHRGPWARAVRAALEELCGDGGSMALRTSGTTGPPKLMRFTARDLWASARLTGRAFGLQEGDRAVHCLPCDFVAGRMMLVRGFVIGLDMHFIDPAGGVLNNLHTDARFRFAAMVPNQLHRALQDDRARLERQFDTVLLGGGPVSGALEEDLRDLGVRVVQGYGSTETLTHVALRDVNGPDRTTHYTAVGDVTFSCDERDRLVVHTPHLTTPHHVTNDLVELLDDRRFRWLGRADNVILTGGRKVHPEELERRTAGLLPFAHYFIGVPDDRLGEAVMLVVESVRPEDEVKAEVDRCLSGALAPHERPRRISVHRAFARTGTGKVQRTDQEG